MPVTANARLERVRFVQPDGRGIVPRKWSVDKLSGGVVFLAERMAKKLIQHGWPVEVVGLASRGRRVVRVGLRLLTGADTAEYRAALLRVSQIEGRRWRVSVVVRDGEVTIAGQWHFVVTEYHCQGKVMKVGRIKPGPLPPPF